MKVNLGQLIYDLDGSVSMEPILDKTDIEHVNKTGTYKIIGNKKVVAKSCIVASLNHTKQETSLDDKMKQGQLLVKLSKGFDFDLESEEVALIKTKVKETQSPLFPSHDHWPQF